MTKEEFRKKVNQCTCDNDGRFELLSFFDKFFESNVVIPKENNSVYKSESERNGALEPIDAVLHMLNGGECVYLDGGTVIWNGERFKYKDQEHGWSLNANFKYLRIKPSEPVYEWQYACVDVDGRGYIGGYYSDNEPLPSDGIKLEATKRERK